MQTLEFTTDYEGAGAGTLDFADTPYPISPELTNVAREYRNDRFIADEVLPRIPVASMEFKYLTANAGELLARLETRVGRKGKPNEVSFTAGEIVDAVHGAALEHVIPWHDLANALDPDEMKRKAVRDTTDLILLDRERRVANLVFGSTSYPPSNVQTLAGASQWNDRTSDPIAAIMDALDSCIMRPNIAVLGRRTWTKLKLHPKVVEAVYWGTADAGVVGPDDVARVLEIDKIIVGDAWHNTAKKGKAASLTRLWGPHAAFLYMGQPGNPNRWGATAAWGERFAFSYEDPNRSVRGAHVIRVGEYVEEFLVSPELGCLIRNAVAG
ncbi:major capsid protein [Methylocaldum sp.]|uniref:major capsid protein n=1 Tax=Methylocaldum sp. TaxID=1969727 RepID=UPI0032201B9A